MTQEIKTSEGILRYCYATCEVYLNGVFVGMARTLREACQVALGNQPWFN